MTDEEISKLTIGDIELIASRLRVAVQTLQEARGLLGGPTTWSPAAQGAQVAPSPALLTAQEQARKEMLMEQNKALPPDILAAMENGGRSVRGG